MDTDVSSFVVIAPETYGYKYFRQSRYRSGHYFRNLVRYLYLKMALKPHFQAYYLRRMVHFGFFRKHLRWILTNYSSSSPIGLMDYSIMNSIALLGLLPMLFVQ